eukprot:6202717-Pleurochrysis_carterae.AAC.1
MHKYFANIVVQIFFHELTPLQHADSCESPYPHRHDHTLRSPHGLAECVSNGCSIYRPYCAAVSSLTVACAKNFVLDCSASLVAERCLPPDCDEEV